jgi:hypothetical protein
MLILVIHVLPAFIKQSRCVSFSDEISPALQESEGRIDDPPLFGFLRSKDRKPLDRSPDIGRKNTRHLFFA